MICAYEITLEQMLNAREARAEKQNMLCTKYLLPVISLTVNIPGAFKSTPVSSRIFREGYDELIKRLLENGYTPVYQETHEFITGSEGYVIVNMDKHAIKELAVQIEMKHSLGRLLDFDVIGEDGVAISREALGYPKRKCLICNEEAHVCARSRAHSIDNLLKKIQSMVDQYFLKFD